MYVYLITRALDRANPPPISLTSTFLLYYWPSNTTSHHLSLSTKDTQFLSVLFFCSHTFFVFVFSEILAISSRAKKDLFKMVSTFTCEFNTHKKTREVTATLSCFVCFLLSSSIYRRLLCSPTGPRHVLHSDTLTPSTSLQTVAIFLLVTTGARRYFTGMPCHASITNLSCFSLSRSICVANVVSGFPFDNLQVGLSLFFK